MPYQRGLVSGAGLCCDTFGSRHLRRVSVVAWSARAASINLPECDVAGWHRAFIGQWAQLYTGFHGADGGKVATELHSDLLARPAQ